jgi:RimJ/RimL family protein N-acetyltransferase
MSDAGWHVRPAIPDDRKLLASFACADPAVRWQAEVEQFIQAQLIDWAFDPHADAGDPRLLLAFTTAGGLFGVAAHERVTLRAGDGTSFPATKLEVVGVALGWQGRSFHTGQRASDVIMSAVMTDVSSRVPPRDARVYAVVHEDNHRSLAVCHRHGLTEEMSRPHPSYRRIVTPHRQR